MAICNTYVVILIFAQALEWLCCKKLNYSCRE